MTGGKHKQPLGYTIVEVMIVLAISSLMFLIAAQFINGKQEQASFKTGVDNFASSLQNTMDDVSNGQFSDINFNCQQTGNGLFLTVPLSGQTSTQGTNPSCVFLGKIIYFYAAPGNASAQSYETFSLAGAATLPTGIPPTSIDSALPTPIIINPSLDLTVKNQIPQDLELVPFASSPNAAPISVLAGYTGEHTYALGVAETWPLGVNGDCQPNSHDSCYYATGAQPTALIYSTNLTTLFTGNSGSSSNQCSGSGAENEFCKNALPHTIEQANSAKLCLTDGTHYAELDIGSVFTAQLSVQTTIRSTLCP
jgi:prepilin-type N-terminal cleavage/methylation domain-containing protein